MAKLVHTEETKKKISEASIRTMKQPNAGFRQRVSCDLCGQIMSPANLGKHYDVCKDTRGKFLDGVELKVNQLNNLRRVLKNSGWTTDRYIEVHNLQKGKCAICGEKNSDGKRLYADHCHNTGKSRGLLCIKCNMGLGAFNDNLTLFHNAISYLRAYKD